MAGLRCASYRSTEIEANGWDLNIGRYVEGAAAEAVDVGLGAGPTGQGTSGVEAGGADTRRATC